MQLKFALILLSLSATSVLSHPIDGSHVPLTTRGQCEQYHCHHHHHHREKPFDVWAFLKGIFGNTDVERPVNNPNMGAFWGQVVFKALAPKFKTRGLETLEARDSTDEAVNFWSNFAQHELDLPALQ